MPTVLRPPLWLAAALLVSCASTTTPADGGEPDAGDPDIGVPSSDAGLLVDDGVALDEGTPAPDVGPVCLPECTVGECLGGRCQLLLDEVLYPVDFRLLLNGEPPPWPEGCAGITLGVRGEATPGEEQLHELELPCRGDRVEGRLELPAGDYALTLTTSLGLYNVRDHPVGELGVDGPTMHDVDFRVHTVDTRIRFDGVDITEEHCDALGSRVSVDLLSDAGDLVVRELTCEEAADGFSLVVPEGTYTARLFVGGYVWHGPPVLVDGTSDLVLGGPTPVQISGRILVDGREVGPDDCVGRGRAFWFVPLDGGQPRSRVIRCDDDGMRFAVTLDPGPYRFSGQVSAWVDVAEVIVTGPDDDMIIDLAIRPVVETTISLVFNRPLTEFDECEGGADAELGELSLLATDETFVRWWDWVSCQTTTFDATLGVGGYEAFIQESFFDPEPDGDLRPLHLDRVVRVDGDSDRIELRFTYHVVTGTLLADGETPALNEAACDPDEPTMATLEFEPHTEGAPTRRVALSCTDPEVTFRANLPPDTYTVRLEREDPTALPEDVALPVWPVTVLDEAFVVDGDRTVDFDAEVEDDGGRIAVAGRVTVNDERLCDDDDRIVGDVVFQDLARGGRYSASVDCTGRYSAAVPAGAYRVIVERTNRSLLYPFAYRVIEALEVR